MNTCALTRLLVPSMLVGLAVSSAAASDPLGWLAAALTALVLAAVGRVRGAGTSCPVDTRPTPAADAGHEPSTPSATGPTAR